MSIAPTVCLLAYVWVLLAVRHTNRTTIHSWNHRSKGLPVVDVEQLSNRRCFILYPQSRSLSVEWLSLLLLRSHCVSHTVCSTSGFWVKQCGQPDLNFLAHSHPPHRSLISYSCRSSEGLPCRPLSAVFPRHLQHVSFLCGRERKWNGKSAPPPTHCGHMAKGGEQSVRSPPATVGHICGRLSPRFSLRRSAAPARLRAAAPRCLSQILKNVGRENNQKRCTFSSLIMSPFSSFPRLFILMGVDTWKGITPLQEWWWRGAGGGIWPHQQSGSPLPVTLRPGWMTSIHWLPLTQTHTQWNQGKGEHADTHTDTHAYYIYKQWKHTIYKTNPTQADPIVATTYFFPHDSSISGCFCLSPPRVTVKLDHCSLLPLSLVSLSRNRTRGGPEIPESGILVGDLIWNLSSPSWWSSTVCVCLCV